MRMVRTSPLTFAMLCAQPLRASSSFDLDDDNELRTFVRAFMSSRPTAKVSRMRSLWLTVKRNTPAVVSLISVILNVVILSLLIPSIRSDVTYMQGQTASMQQQLNNANQQIIAVNQLLNTATSTVAQFDAQVGSITAQFNNAQTLIANWSTDSANDLLHMESTANALLSNFMLTSIQLEQELKSTLNQSRADAAQLEFEANITASIDALNLPYLKSELQSISDDFTQHVIPSFERTMAAMNQTALDEAMRNATAVAATATQQAQKDSTLIAAALASMQSYTTVITAALSFGDPPPSCPSPTGCTATAVCPSGYSLQMAALVDAPITYEVAGLVQFTCTVGADGQTLTTAYSAAVSIVSPSNKVISCQGLCVRIITGSAG